MSDPTPDTLTRDAADTSVGINRRMTAIEGRMTAVEQGMKENTKITAEIAEGTTELLDLFKSVKGGFKVMGWLGNFAKWVAGIAAAFAAVYAYVQSIRGH